MYYILLLICCSEILRESWMWGQLSIGDTACIFYEYKIIIIIYNWSVWKWPQRKMRSEQEKGEMNKLYEIEKFSKTQKFQKISKKI